MSKSSKVIPHWIAVVALVLALVAGLAPRIALAADVTCANPCDSAALQAAIDGANAGDVILVPTGAHTLTTNVNINKAVTVRGEEGAVFQVSGTGYRISLTAAGARLESLEIVKTDKIGIHNIIYLSASGVVLDNLTVHGQWVMGDGEVSRAVEATGGLTGVVIQNSTFYGLRQPGYLNTSEILIKDNYVYGTRGWVLEGANATFTGNTWGQEGEANAVDIAILDVTDPALYPDILAVSAANNDAVIEDQRSGVITHVWVDASASAGGNGYSITPFQSIQAGINKVVSGGKLFIAAGEYLENEASYRDMVITKSLNLYGAGKGQTVVRLTEGKTNGVEINGTGLSILFDGLTFTRQEGSDYGPDFALRFGEAGNTFSSVVLSDVEVAYALGRNAIFEKGDFASITLQNSDFHHAGSWGLSVDAPTSALTVTGSTFNDNGSNDASHGIGLDIGNGGITNVTVTGGEFNRNTSKGINVVNTSKAVFDGIQANENAGDPLSSTGMTIWEWVGESSDITIKNGEFANNGRIGILMGADASKTIDGILITGSVFIGNPVGGVYAWTFGSVSDVVIHHNIFTGNGDGVFNNQAGSLLAENNWWGCNEGPSDEACDSISAGVDADPWLVLSLAANPMELIPGAASELTASLVSNSDGEETSPDYLPDGMTVAFTASAGTLSEASVLTQNSQAQTTLTAGAADSDHQVCAEVDNAQVCLDLTVENPPTVLFLPMIFN